MQTGYFMPPGSFYAHFAEETVFHLALDAKEFGISRTAHCGAAVFASLRNPRHVQSFGETAPSRIEPNGGCAPQCGCSSAPLVQVQT
jgi:hypothetical protein